MVVLLIARLGLAAVFAVAGLAKLADRAGSRRAMLEFGVPARLAAGAALLLPLAEIAVAAALLVPDTAAIGAIAAAALLAMFASAIATNLARGRSPDCHCFGQLHSAPAGPKTLVRNIVLGVVAAVVAVLALDDPGPSPVGWLSELSDAGLVAVLAGAVITVLVAAGGWLATHLLRAYGRLLLRVEDLEARLNAGGGVLELEHYEPGVGLAPGSEVPAFELESVAGERVSLELLLAHDRPLVLVFADPGCGPCRGLVPEIAGWQRDLAEELTIAVVSGDEGGRQHPWRRELKNVLLQRNEEVSGAFEAYGTPAAVLVSADGTIASFVAQGAEEIRALVDRALTQYSDPEPAGLPVGSPAPELELPVLDGGRIRLDQLRGQELLLAFWNPSCGFCQEMRDELKQWESQKNGDGPRLVIVSSGEREATRAEGFSSIVLMDEEHAAGTAFEAAGTPMAVLLDEDGRVASPLAAGREAVLDLARERAAVVA